MCVLAQTTQQMEVKVFVWLTPTGPPVPNHRKFIHTNWNQLYSLDSNKHVWMQTRCGVTHGFLSYSSWFIRTLSLWCSVRLGGENNWDGERQTLICESSSSETKSNQLFYGRDVTVMIAVCNKRFPHRTGEHHRTTKTRTGVLVCSAEKLPMSFKDVRLTALKSFFHLRELEVFTKHWSKYRAGACCRLACTVMGL